MLCAVESQGSFLTRRACARWHVVIAWMPWDWVGLHWGCIHGHALCTTHLSCSAITQIAAAQAHARSPSSVHFDESHHLARTHMQHARGTPLQRSLPCHTHFHRRCLLCSLPDALSQKMPAVQSARRTFTEDACCAVCQTHFHRKCCCAVCQTHFHRRCLPCSLPWTVSDGKQALHVRRFLRNNLT